MKPIIVQATSGWSRINIRQLYSYREVLFMLLRRNLKARYAQTYLGVGWILFQPLFTVLLFSVIFGRWMQMSSDGVPYFLFAFTGLICWIFISSCIQRASGIMLMDSRLITKIYFPRLLMPLASLLETLIETFFLVAVLSLLLLFNPTLISWKMTLFPLWIVPLCLLGLGMGSLFSSLGVYYRDAVALLPFFLQTWMYCSPIVYSTSAVPEKWISLYRLNPMAGILDAMRWSFLNGSNFPTTSFLTACCVALFIGFAGVYIFCRLERNFADVL
ncbi:MAG: ABC transporter permease [Verrucomicrobia bacterium]|nr:ABC transporter permease [Verrucomicrobiota bacterium]